MIWRALPYALFRRARIGARYAYLHVRHKVRMRLIRIERVKARKGLAIRVQPENKRQSVTEVRDGGLTRHWRESR